MQLDQSWPSVSLSSYPVIILGTLWSCQSVLLAAPGAVRVIPFYISEAPSSKLHNSGTILLNDCTTHIHELKQENKSKERLIREFLREVCNSIVIIANENFNAY